MNYHNLNTCIFRIRMPNNNEYDSVEAKKKRSILYTQTEAKQFNVLQLYTVLSTRKTFDTFTKQFNVRDKLLQVFFLLFYMLCKV